MKKVLIAVMLSSVTFQAEAATNNKQCIAKIQKQAHAMFRSDCGGFGGRNNCEVTISRNRTSGYLNAKVDCFFTGEPDYSAQLEAEYIVKQAGCVIESEKVITCADW